MGSADRILVVARGTEVPARQTRIDASTPALALDALAAADDVSLVCAVLDDGIDHDEFVALVSVLVVRGVTMFDTEHPQIVRRVLDTHSAIVAGQVEVLQQ